MRLPRRGAESSLLPFFVPRLMRDTRPSRCDGFSDRLTTAFSFYSDMRRNMRKTLASLAAVALMSSAPAFAAETMKGKISDAMCGAKHAASEHGGTTTDRDCVEKCVKEGA